VNHRARITESGVNINFEGDLILCSMRFWKCTGNLKTNDGWEPEISTETLNYQLYQHEFTDEFRMIFPPNYNSDDVNSTSLYEILLGSLEKMVITLLSDNSGSLQLNAPSTFTAALKWLKIK